MSTAYYALFHLLITDAVTNWKRIDQRPDLARAFDHAGMRKASKRIAGLKFSGKLPAGMADLQRVADAFDQLQEFRHFADYDSSQKWSRSDALAAVNCCDAAFRAWRAIRTEKIAQDYLFELLFPRR